MKRTPITRTKPLVIPDRQPAIRSDAAQSGAGTAPTSQGASVARHPPTLPSRRGSNRSAQRPQSGYARPPLVRRALARALDCSPGQRPGSGWGGRSREILPAGHNVTSRAMHGAMGNFGLAGDCADDGLANVRESALEGLAAEGRTLGAVKSLGLARLPFNDCAVVAGLADKELGHFNLQPLFPRRGGQRSAVHGCHCVPNGHYAQGLFVGANP